MNISHQLDERRLLALLKGRWMYLSQSIDPALYRAARRLEERGEVVEVPGHPYCFALA